MNSQKEYHRTNIFFFEKDLAKEKNTWCNREYFGISWECGRSAIISFPRYISTHEWGVRWRVPSTNQQKMLFSGSISFCWRIYFKPSLWLHFTGFFCFFNQAYDLGESEYTFGMPPKRASYTGRMMIRNSILGCRMFKHTKCQICPNYNERCWWRLLKSWKMMENELVRLD